jgi:hypothetical protein
MGVFGIYVLNPLNAPATVSSSVQILMEVSATDVMFSGPSNVTMLVATGNTAPFTPQGDFSGLEASREKSVVLGNLKSVGFDANLPRFCVGEEISSFKQVLQRKTLLRTNSISATGIRTVSFKPFSIGGTFMNTSAWTDHPMSGDYLSVISCCYVLSRGSVRYSVYCNANDNFACSYAIEPRVSTAPDFSTSTTQNAFPSGLIFQTKSAQTGYVNFEIPQCSYTHSRENQIDFENGAKPYPLGVPESTCHFSCNATFGNFADVRIQRSAGDDYQLGFFIGVPSLFVFEGTRTL